jgi:hypothetical protein
MILNRVINLAVSGATIIIFDVAKSLGAPRVLVVGVLCSILATGASAADRFDLLKHPKSQRDFLAIIVERSRSYQEGIQDARALRAKELCARFLDRLNFSNWVGFVDKLSTDSEGRGSLAISIANNVQIKTGWQPKQYDTRIAANSDMYGAIRNLMIGDQVRFSGWFTHNEMDCFLQTSTTTRAAMNTPEFVFEFFDVTGPAHPTRDGDFIGFGGRVAEISIHEALKYTFRVASEDSKGYWVEYQPPANHTTELAARLTVGTNVVVSGKVVGSNVIACEMRWPDDPTRYAPPTSGDCAADVHRPFTAICNDGTVSHSAYREGTCSRHRGVREWLYDPLSTVIKRPVTKPPKPAPATDSKPTPQPKDSNEIKCNDGTLSHSKHRRGACSHHGGIR